MCLPQKLCLNIAYYVVYRLRIRLLEQESIHDTTLWEQKIFIGSVPLSNQPDELEPINVLSRKGSAREKQNTGKLRI